MGDHGPLVLLEVQVELVACEEQDQRHCHQRHYAPQVGARGQVTRHLLEHVQLPDLLVQAHYPHNTMDV